MSDAFDKFKNPDGTYDGAALMAAVTGFSRDEVIWTFNRTKELKAKGVPKLAIKRILREEALGRPWEFK